MKCYVWVLQANGCFFFYATLPFEIEPRVNRYLVHIEYALYKFRKLNRAYCSKLVEN